MYTRAKTAIQNYVNPPGRVNPSIGRANPAIGRANPASFFHHFLKVESQNHGHSSQSSFKTIIDGLARGCATQQGSAIVCFPLITLQRRPRKHLPTGPCIQAGQRCQQRTWPRPPEAQLGVGTWDLAHALNIVDTTQSCYLPRLTITVTGIQMGVPTFESVSASGSCCFPFGWLM